ncbi:hypothetical protein ACOT81_39690 [Streptomyces sp. WI04-05B]|uniref:Uncharacterized protein n=1 Tax=Streptomyces turgidiscabies (strain Car8) TaxID=698760 RepID=L7F683_STRT8|nr:MULTISPECIES: hypothetical protein [Streptomyces]ELP66150.1 hypothetical protein STRTUCAR8_10251 [Streptomyces turgidiscabies Car8]MDX2549055.1 hypothetical protein [Streptomyces sp. WI04-05B]MDX2590617.1 hypothetical protein [Streptomyces sp. WI04-05A]MDX3499718.1 hypothetical protein [Streptomyces turgidiscabies]
MIDLYRATDWLKSAAGYDANIPRSLRGETRTLVAWAVTVQLSFFLLLVVLPLILVTEAWQAPAGVAAASLSWAASRHSSLRYLRVRLV